MGSKVGLASVHGMGSDHPIEEQQPGAVVDLVLQCAGFEGLGGDLAWSR